MADMGFTYGSVRRRTVTPAEEAWPARNAPNEHRLRVLLPPLSVIALSHFMDTLSESSYLAAQQRESAVARIGLLGTPRNL